MSKTRKQKNEKKDESAVMLLWNNAREALACAEPPFRLF